jgi:hypothetical protein
MDQTHEPIAPALLECTLRSLRELQQRLEGDQPELERKVAELRTTIHQLEAQRRNSSASAPRERHRKGENLQRIRQLLAADGEAGLSLAQIAEQTGLSLTSVQAVLHRPGNGFRKDERSGRYRLDPAAALGATPVAKPPAPPAPATPAGG